MMQVAINGFGRIGKNFLRVFLQDKKAHKLMQIRVINTGPDDPAHTAYLFKYDTLMGTYPGKVLYEENQLLIDDYPPIQVIAQTNPLHTNWGQEHIWWVVDCSGKFTDAQKAQYHCHAGAKHVLLSAPAHGEDITIIPGVNMDAFNPKKHRIVSLGSCTTNAFIPLLKVIHEQFNVTQGMMVTTHAYTNTQLLLDGDRPDVRRARAAALNIIPTSTGAGELVEKFFPDLAPSITSMSIRVPVAKVSLLDFTFLAQKTLSTATINQALSTAAATSSLAPILAVEHNELVSADFSGTAFSVIVDAPLTSAHGQLGKIFGWYDNEWAYSMRLKDFLVHAGSL